MESPVTTFTIRPNAGYPRRNWRWLLGILIVLSLGIALRFAWLGFWMILPFTLLELGILVALMELVRRRGSYTESILVSNEQVEILHRQRGKDKDWQFPLYWTRIDLRKPSHRWYPHRLLIGSSGSWVEVGQCLTEEEREGLVGALRKAMSRHRERPATMPASDHG